jgi:hypothetical protein
MWMRSVVSAASRDRRRRTGYAGNIRRLRTADIAGFPTDGTLASAIG